LSRSSSWYDENIIVRKKEEERLLRSRTTTTNKDEEVLSRFVGHSRNEPGHVGDVDVDGEDDGVKGK